jgi:hypothetical protein
MRGMEKLARNKTLDGAPALVTELEDEFKRVCQELQVERGHAA